MFGSHRDPGTNGRPVLWSLNRSGTSREPHSWCLLPSASNSVQCPQSALLEMPHTRGRPLPSTRLQPTSNSSSLTSLAPIQPGSPFGSTQDRVTTAAGLLTFGGIYHLAAVFSRVPVPGVIGLTKSPVFLSSLHAFAFRPLAFVAVPLVLRLTPGGSNGPSPPTPLGTLLPSPREGGWAGSGTEGLSALSRSSELTNSSLALTRVDGSLSLLSGVLGSLAAVLRRLLDLLRSRLLVLRDLFCCFRLLLADLLLLSFDLPSSSSPLLLLSSFSGDGPLL